MRDRESLHALGDFNAQKFQRPGQRLIYEVDEEEEEILSRGVAFAEDVMLVVEVTKSLR